MGIIYKWIILSATVYALPHFISGISVSPWWTILIVGACLIFLLNIAEPILRILTFPINLLTLGLFAIVINALLFWALGHVIPGFVVSSFTTALIGSIVVAVVNWIATKIFKN